MCLMEKTIDVANDREFDQSKTVLPIEIARGIYVENPPSAQALKLMHLLIAVSGGRMADDVQHELRMADIKAIDGMRNHDRDSLKALFKQLRASVLVYDDTKAQCEIIGGFMDEIRLDYRHENSGDLIVKWWFGRTFRTMAAASNHWAIIDRQTVFALSSKYSILLFQHIASFVKLKHIKSKTFTVQELRAVLGVENQKLERFSHLNSRAIQPAVEEINQLSRFTLTATPKKVGRTVETVTISWEEKPDPSRAKRELSSASIGRKVRREGTEETIIEAFPASGAIYFGGGEYTGWAKVARDNLPEPRPDLNVVADKFRKFTNSRKINLSAHDIEQKFATFCQKEWAI